jgi:hypothetical protein
MNLPGLGLAGGGLCLAAATRNRTENEPESSTMTRLPKQPAYTQNRTMKKGNRTMNTRNQIRTVLILAAVAMASTLPAGAAPITVPNAGFEVRGTYDPFDDGVDKYNQYNQESWRHWQRTANGGPLRIWNPGAPGCVPQGTLDVGFGGNAPEGTYVVVVRSRYSDGLNTDGVNYFEAATQLLTATFDPTLTYTLTVEVGKLPGSAFYTPDWHGYAVQLAVGGTNVGGAQYAGSVNGGVVIAQDANSLTVPVDSFVTSTVTYYPDPANAALAGQPLQIRLCALEDPANLALTSWVVFDDVKLDGVAGPPPFTGTSTTPRPARAAPHRPAPGTRRTRIGTPCPTAPGPQPPGRRAT